MRCGPWSNGPAAASSAMARIATSWNWPPARRRSPPCRRRWRSSPSCWRSCAAARWRCPARNAFCTWWKAEPREATPDGAASLAASALQRRVVRFAGADTDDAIDLRDEDLAVADLAGLCGLHDRFDDLIDQVAADSDFDAGFRNKIHDILRATIELGMTALTTEALHFRHGHAGDTNFRQRSTNVVKFERLDDCSNQFHARLPPPLFSGRLSERFKDWVSVCTFRATGIVAVNPSGRSPASGSRWGTHEIRTILAQPEFCSARSWCGACPSHPPMPVRARIAGACDAVAVAGRHSPFGDRPAGRGAGGGGTPATGSSGGVTAGATQVG